MDQVVVTRLGKGFLRIFISIIPIRLDRNIETQSIYIAFIGFHRLIILVPILGALVKSSTVCNTALRQTCFRIDYNKAEINKPKSMTV